MKVHILLFFLSMLGVPSHGDLNDCMKSSHHVHFDLTNSLLCDYDPEIRPKLDHKNATTVFVKMIIQSFAYDLYTNIIIVNNWMPMSWVDDHLKWTPSDYDDIELIHLRASEIWTPDLAPHNKHGQDDVHKVVDSDLDCIVRYTGSVTCVPTNNHEAVCTSDLKKYPYDTLECALKFASWIHPGNVIDFRFNKAPVTIATSAPNDEWKLLSVRMAEELGTYECCPNDTYPSLKFIFILKRLPSYHEATIIIPGLAIITNVLFTFLLNSTETERVYLIIVSILFHLIFLINITWELPKFGKNVPNILIFANDSLIICVVQLAVTLMQRRMIKSAENNAGWISGSVVTLVQSRIGQAILVFDNSVSKAVAIAKGDEDGTNIIEKTQSANNLDYIIFAKLLDRVLCIIFIIIYITMFFKLILN